MISKTETKKEKKLKAIDLFSGCGGLTLGLKKAGFEVIGAVEIDTLSVETYKENHPEVIVWEKDIRDITIKELKNHLNIEQNELDLLSGCPPCQGFSSMRTLNGAKCIDEPMNNLIFEFLRFVEGLKPKAIMMENVPGLTKDYRLTKFCKQLRLLGYIVDYGIYNASDYNVPQRRRRMILLAGKSGKIDFALPVGKKRTVRDAIGSLPEPGKSGDPLHDFPEIRSQRIMELIKKIPKDGGSRTDLSTEQQLKCHIRCDGFKDVYGRMSWNEVAPTITGGCFNPSKGRFLHPEQDRSITIREAALLQSFPKDYKFSLRRGKTGACTMIGNALPPEFIFHHAGRIRKYLTFTEGALH